MKKGPVLVTGANGHIGLALVDQLIAKGYSVRASVRNVKDPSKTRRLKALGAELYEAEILDIPNLRKAIDGVIGVFHNAAPNIGWAKDPEKEILVPYLQGTLNVLTLAHELGVKRVLTTSSCGTIGIESRLPGGGEVIYDESYFYANPITAIMQAKVRAEHVVLDFCKKHDLSVVMLCPTAIVGPGFDRVTPTTQIFDQAIKGKFPPLPEGGCHFVDVRDFVEAQIRAFENPKAEGRYIIAGEFITMSGFMRLVKKVDPSIKVPSFQLPGWALHGIRPLDWFAHKALKQPRKLTGAMIREFVGKVQKVSTKKANRDLDWTFRPIEVTVRDTLAWVREASPREQ